MGHSVFTFGLQCVASLISQGGAIFKEICYEAPPRSNIVFISIY